MAQWAQGRVPRFTSRSANRINRGPRLDETAMKEFNLLSLCPRFEWTIPGSATLPSPGRVQAFPASTLERGGVKKLVPINRLALPLTPGPSPRWGEGKVNTKFNSLARFGE